MGAGSRSHVNNLVCGPDDLLFVFHDNDRVAKVTQFLQCIDKHRGVTRVESDTGFVEDIKRACQTASERGCQVDSLRFTSREGVGKPVEGKIGEPHLYEETQPLLYLLQKAACNLLLLAVEHQLPEEAVCFTDGDGGDLCN
ncbi:MAG: hypothetical protein BWY89_01650 [Bacteroidetes bacterium ADurb.BinA012]|nr:MAG: hypothetical protein BWY89_01650 [Bacteroidetes bacterium ADurb.BinA012]